MSGGHSTYATQAEFASGQPHEGSPETLFRRRPDRSFVRKFFNDRMRFPDGAEHEIWGFEDDDSGRGLPSPLVRVQEGEVVHVTLESSKRAHTIHWHGVEPDPRNDGVGHTSFEVTGSYTYQWQMQKGVPGDPNVGCAGSYFYHCHVNTVLHVQMGMFGPVIVDPVPAAGHPVPAGARLPFVDGPPYDVATETILVPYSVDPRWHGLGHAAGLSGEDAGLNRFSPRHFYVLGGLLAEPPRGDGVQALSRLRANLEQTGHPTLLRVLNANYVPTRLRFFDPDGAPVKMAQLIAHDGRPFRDTSQVPSPPIARSRDALRTAVIAFGAAERYDLLLHPERAGTYSVQLEWLDWRSQKPLAKRTLPLVAA